MCNFIYSKKITLQSLSGDFSLCTIIFAFVVSASSSTIYKIKNSELCCPSQCLYSQSPRMEQRLRVTRGLRQTLKDKIARGSVRGRSLPLVRHFFVRFVLCILPIDNPSHAAKCFGNLRGRHNSVEEPIGDMLAADAERRTILHKANIVNVWNLRATNSLVHPSNHVP